MLSKGYNMLDINTILNNKKIIINKKKINVSYENALEFLIYLNFPHERKDVVFIMGLIKRYGEDKVMALKSYLKDIEKTPRDFKSLMVWKLKEFNNL